MKMANSSILDLVKKIKEEMFSSVDLYSFVSPSAYDTAWLAMIPDPQQPDHPMFRECLDWVVNNQNEDGFWGELESRKEPTIDCLPATLACMVALQTWNVGTNNIKKGLDFIHANMEKLLIEQHDYCPRWFAIVFPAMVEHARAIGLEVVFPESLLEVVEDIFSQRRRILETEELVNQYSYPPLLSYLEALPPSYDIDLEEILGHVGEDGSLFQSPSATACAFMATGNNGCRLYLESVVQRCGNAVPPIYPMDEELIRLCMIDRLERLGLAEHFLEEIENILTNVFRNYVSQESQAMRMDVMPLQIYKDSLSFRLLRMHGYHVSPWRFCWFLCNKDIQLHIEENYEYFISAMFNVYRATDLMFSGEEEFEAARSFAKKILERAIALESKKKNAIISPKFQSLIEHELKLPWLARLDHLEHRMCIEGNEMDAPWMGKASFRGLSCLYNDMLLQLAMENFKFRQSIHKKELEELKRWSKDSGLCDMGFGREKTTYCYFGISSSFPLQCYYDVRMVIAKSAILVTVTDDFFDMEGSLDELKSLTNAIKRWEGKGLSGHSKVIFDALNDVVSDMAEKYFLRQGQDITKNLQDIWYQTFASWLTEAEWSKSGYVPSIDEYLRTGMISVAVHTLVLPASCLLTSSLPKHMLRRAQYKTITKLLMVSTRLLNDIQSYQKEMEDGKMNLVLLHLKENPQDGIQESIAYIQKILDKTKKELLEHVLMDHISYMPKPSKQLYLSGLKVFQMFFNSSNGFDSDTEMFSNINKAIYHPLEVEIQRSQPVKPLLPHHGSNKWISTTNAQLIAQKPNKHHGWQSFQTIKISCTKSKGWCGVTKFTVPKSTLRMV